MKHFPTMYRLYCVLKDWAEPPMAKEIGFASGKTVLDPKSDAKYLKKLEAATENIQKAFATQEADAAVCLTVLFSFLLGTLTNSVNQGPWDQAKFERLLSAH
jgi:hypothetical protein